MSPEHLLVPVERLQLRALELQNLQTIPHGEERLMQITNELNRIVFELAMRKIDETKC